MEIVVATAPLPHQTGAVSVEDEPMSAHQSQGRPSQANASEPGHMFAQDIGPHRRNCPPQCVLDARGHDQDPHFPVPVYVSLVKVEGGAVTANLAAAIGADRTDRAPERSEPCVGKSPHCINGIGRTPSGARAAIF
ncbi:hypothetical protein H8A97_09345 [Bradyrhizobium sp. Arg62]|uniref:hypothetical protein n=1 Tax=Bradyrhizobium brasilense TaxID=1419277 RepID=UPI001E406961|nr:hypothetical protein [Bradyrhizobium brasilense]MCC8945308.1 hypothetical protein [Bradyrhizobium brasilense]